MATHIGTSGWSYDHRNGVLCPHGTSARERLGLYVVSFATVELNASLYRWPRDDMWTGWRRRLPNGFVMWAQAPRGLTRAKRLYAPETWSDDAVFDILERHGAAHCVMSGARLPCVLRSTAPFVYVRLHGPAHDHLYAGSSSDDDLHRWAGRIAQRGRSGHDVFACFDNDGDGHAVRNAMTLIPMLDEPS